MVSGGMTIRKAAWNKDTQSNTLFSADKNKEQTIKRDNVTIFMSFDLNAPIFVHFYMTQMWVHKNKKT